MRDKKIPVYVGDFGQHDVRNIPLTFRMRWQLIKFLRELQKSSEIFGSYYVVEVSEVNKRLIDTLLVPLTSFLQRVTCREACVKAMTDFDNFVTDTNGDPTEKNDCQSVHEKNLKPSLSTDFFQNMPTFTDMVATISLMTILATVIFLSTII